MADLSKYPNPLRLFTQTRDEWFTRIVSSFDIPMHIFSAVRDTQLGQLMFAIETVRMKRKRAGEDPGPGLLEGDNASMFIPLFSLVKQFQELLDNEDLELDKNQFIEEILGDDLFSELSEAQKTGQEWFTPLTLERLDQLNQIMTKITTEALVNPLKSALEISNSEELKEKLTEMNSGFAGTFYSFYQPDIASAIESGEFNEGEGEEQIRIFSINEEERQLTFNEYHGQINLHYGFLLELKRLSSDIENYGFKFEMLEPLLSLEMLIMFPVPDTTRLPLVKQHLTQLSKSTMIPRAFADLLGNTYQAFTRIEEANPRMVRKLFTSLEKSMKEDTRTFWKQVIKSSEADIYNVLVAVLWSHLRALQTQAQYREQQSGHQGHSHSQTHAITVRLEHIFWVQGRKYHEREKYLDSYQFWSAYAAIANKQVRKQEDSLELFYELDELLTATNGLVDKKQQKKLDINQADQYSLIQRVLSYGLEARSVEAHPGIDEYLKILEKLLEVIDVDQMHDNFDLEQEEKVIEDIRTHMQNTVALNPN